MSAVLLGVFLDRLFTFEDRLASFFEVVRDQSRDNGVRLLTYYMSRQRRQQREAFADTEPGLLKQIKKIEVRQDVEFCPEAASPLLALRPAAVTGKEFLDAAVAYDKALVAFFRQVLAGPVNDEVRALIESLIRAAEHDILMMKKMIAMNCF
jgi:hypothetical protein